MIRIATCDDSMIDQNILKKMVNEIIKDRDLGCEITTYTNGEQLLESYHPGQFDLIFMDIYMKDINGIETARRIREIDVEVEVVFCTSSSEFLLAGYDLFALGYLLKPFKRGKLVAIIDYYLQRNPEHIKKCIAINARKKTHTIQYRDIIFIESNDKIVTFHTSSHGDISLPGQLSKVQEELNDKRFLRCNQSYIVNMDMIVKREDAEVIMMNGQRIPLRMRGRKLLVDTIKEYLLSNSEAQLC
ncbi:MAG: LytTR family DNA-binding domain-containing protein [Lachnospiraceae bacterium]